LKRRTLERRAARNVWTERSPGVKSKKGPKQPTVTQRARLQEFLKKAGLRRTKAQRRSEHAALERIVDHKILKLSDVVGQPGKPGKASRYTRTGTKFVYKVVKKPGPAREVRGPFGDIFCTVPAATTTEKILVAEQPIAKRVGKKGTGKKGSSRGEGSVRLGSAAAVRTLIKAGKHKRAGKKGGKMGREAKKKKK